MIDLNYFKLCIEKDVHLSEILTSDLIEFVSRAIAAESERDEIKAKLAELTTQLPCGYMGSDAAHTVVMNSKFMVGDMPEGLVPVYASPKPSAPAQRITEQDAREICSTYNSFRMQGHALEPLGIINKWLHSEGRPLLAKLNEHREPEVAQEPVQWVCEHKDNPWPKGGGKRFDTKEQALHYLISEFNFSKYTAVSPIYRQPVTANKAEVPSNAILKFLEMAQELIDDNPYLYPEIARTRTTDWMAHILERPNGNPIITGQGLSPEEACQAAINSLPPLKDGE